MSDFTNEYVKKEKDKKLRTTLVGLGLIILAVVFIFLREKKVEKVLKEKTDLNSVIVSSDRIDKRAYVTINYYNAFANYSDEKYNSYYIVFDGDYFYIVYMNNNKADEITEEMLEEGYTLEGYTLSVDDDVKSLAIDALNEMYKDYEDAPEFTIEDFDNIFGGIYLNTVRGKYSIAIYHNLVIYFAGFTGIGLLIIGLVKLLLYSKKIKKLTPDEVAILDKELNNPYSKYYEMAHIFIGENYLIDFNNFGYYNYKDIKWVYTHINRTNGAKTNEQLVINTTDGKLHYIASTSGSKKTRVIYDDIYEALTSKNPNIKVGYTSENIKINNEENKEIKKEKKQSKDKQ